MCLSPGIDDHLCAYSVTSSGGEPGNKRKSRSGILFFWKRSHVHLQLLSKVTALSSLESEYMALAETARGIRWLRKITHELHTRQQSNIIHEDNHNSIGSSEGGKARHFTRRKHIDIRQDIIIDMVDENAIGLVKTDTKEMFAAFLSKTSRQTAFNESLTKLNLFGTVSKNSIKKN